MGGSSSKSTIRQTENIVMINKNYFEQSNQVLNQLITNHMTSAAQSCQSFSVQNVSGDIILGDVSGTIRDSYNVSQETHVNLECIQEQEIIRDIQEEIIKDIMTELQSNVDQDILSNMNAAASTKAESGGFTLPWSGSSADSNVEQTRNYTYQNEDYKYLENIVANTVVQNFNEDSVQKCTNSVIQNVPGDRVVGNVSGEIINAFNIDQSSKVVVECLNSQKVGLNIVTNIRDKLYSRGEWEWDQSVDTGSDATAEAESKKKGILEEIIGTLMAPFMALLAPLGITSAPLVSSMSSACCLFCCCFIIIIIVAISELTKNSEIGTTN